MQQPSAFCDSAIINWINDTRRSQEGFRHMVVIRDMFAGGFSPTTMETSIRFSHINGFIAGKMTPVLQITDIGVAFNLKRKLDHVKREIRHNRVASDNLSQCLSTIPLAEARAGVPDLIQLVDESWHRLVAEEVGTDGLLRTARRAGWLSYQADPETGLLVRADTFQWAQAIQESAHRHPQGWWAGMYQ